MDKQGSDWRRWGFNLYLFTQNNAINWFDLLGLAVIVFDKSQDRKNITEHSKTVIGNIADKAGVTKIYITSINRSAKKQMEAMYKLFKKVGVKKAYALYGSTGDKVVKIYENGVKLKKTAKQIKKDMLTQINKEPPSVHINQNPLKTGRQAIDISHSRMPEAQRPCFEKEVKKNNNVDNNRFYKPPKDPAYHLEIINQLMK